MPDDPERIPAEQRGGLCVFAPGLLLSVTVEQSEYGDEVHLHPGGQGYWMARAIERLGEPVVLCTGLGGEVGDVLVALVTAQTSIELVDVRHAASSPAYVHSRVDGEREEHARVRAPVLERHTADKLYSLTLAHAARRGVCVLAGNHDCAVLPTTAYRRLGIDLATLEVRVVTDLHGPELPAVVDGGAVAFAKVSDDDLRADGVLRGDGDRALGAAIATLASWGSFDFIVTRGPDAPAIARLGGRYHRVHGPRLAAVDWRGSGDAMAGAIAVAIQRGYDPLRTLRFGTAAGAASVTRRGLASVDAVLVQALEAHVEVEAVDSIDAAVAPDDRS
ncbi:MAG: PfkB family carbohydrate kinase [Acidimicrobiales bacterium]